MVDIPLKGRPEQVIPELVEFVAGVVEHFPVARFRFIVDGNAATTQEQLGCDQTFFVYAAADKHQAALVVDMLFMTFCHHRLYAAGDGVRVQTKEDTQVYLAVWMERS